MRATLRPAVSTSVILAVAGAPVGGVGITGIVEDPSSPAAWLLACGYAALVLYTLSARLDLEGRVLTFRRYGRIVWRCDAAHAAFEEGGVGEIGALRGIVVTDARSGAKVGEILSSNFHRADLERFIGNVRSERASRASPLPG